MVATPKLTTLSSKTSKQVSDWHLNQVAFREQYPRRLRFLNKLPPFWVLAAVIVRSLPRTRRRAITGAASGARARRQWRTGGDERRRSARRRRLLASSAAQSTGAVLLLGVCPESHSWPAMRGGGGDRRFARRRRDPQIRTAGDPPGRQRRCRVGDTGSCGGAAQRDTERRPSGQ